MHLEQNDIHGMCYVKLPYIVAYFGKTYKYDSVHCLFIIIIIPYVIFPLRIAIHFSNEFLALKQRTFRNYGRMGLEHC